MCNVVPSETEMAPEAGAISLILQGFCWLRG
jgi:hypothetical protein